MRIAVWIFGLASVASGLFDLLWRGFDPSYQPIQAFGDHVPGAAVMAIIAALALIAGGLAAFLATRGGTPPQTVVQTISVPQHTETQVLVAKTPIGVGQRLDAASVEWQDWPQSAIRPEYITSTRWLMCSTTARSWAIKR